MLEFPLPRAQLPKIEVTPQEHAAAKNMMERMLLHTVREFEQYTYEDKGVVDNKRWKSMASKDQLRVYKERQTGALSASLAFALEDTSGLPVGSTIAALTPASMMMTGTCPGRVENAMHAVVTKSQQELAMVVIYLHEDVADCAILNTMEGPTLDNPYGFLGYKYFVRKSPTSSHLVKHRDNLYLEYTGITRTSTGEELGYHMMHSVDLPSFPDLTEMNSVTALSSLRYLYRQKTDNIVEIFCIGNMDISGMLTSIGPMSTFFVSEIMFGCTRLIDCAETKRLTEMIEKRRQCHDQPQIKPRANECAICRHKKKVFGASLLAECNVCGNSICSRCRTHKKVFISDGILGKFQKVACCKTCVLVANAGYVQPRMNTGSNKAPSSHNSMDSGDRRPTSSSGSSITTSSYTFNDAQSESSASSSYDSVSQNGDICDLPPQLIRHYSNASSAHSGSSTSSRNRRAPSYEQQHEHYNHYQHHHYHNHPNERHHRANSAQSTYSTQSTSSKQSDLIPLVENMSLNGQHNDLIPLESKTSLNNTENALEVYERNPRAIVRTNLTSLSNDRHHQPRQLSRHMSAPQAATTKSSGPYYLTSSSMDGKSYGYAPSVGATSTSSSEYYSVASDSSTVSSSVASAASNTKYNANQNAIFARMVQLSKVAESTYNTTQQNAAYLARQNAHDRR